MGLFSSLFSRKTTDLQVPDSPTPRSLWKALDNDYDRLESQRPSQANKKRGGNDIWDKLDDFYTQQEQRLGRCATRTTL